MDTLSQGNDGDTECDIECDIELHAVCFSEGLIVID